MGWHAKTKRPGLQTFPRVCALFSNNFANLCHFKIVKPALFFSVSMFPETTF
jgi:hypothetical protein